MALSNEPKYQNFLNQIHLFKQPVVLLFANNNRELWNDNEMKIKSGRLLYRLQKLNGLWNILLMEQISQFHNFLLTELGLDREKSVSCTPSSVKSFKYLWYLYFLYYLYLYFPREILAMKIYNSEGSVLR